ncbi:YihY/virulence factor BrkB family protein [Compostibacter hankyongensis]|uniref:YihY/virulence factor BrkB family protein n=1 Tax=Compostibacter hankyongensis TaxID=1007089 RepID=A0ABP8FII8_9BACT
MRSKLFSKTGSVLRQAFTEFLEDKVMRMSAALAYYTIFSIGPMLIVITYLCSIFLREKAATGTVYEQIKDLVGPDAALQIQSIITNASVTGSFSAATLIGVVALVFGATGIFAEIQDSINHIWHLKAQPPKGKGFLKMLLNRLLSFSMVVSLGFILLVSLLLNTVLDLLLNQLGRLLPETTIYLTYTLNFAITLCITTLLFAIIFKVLPDAHMRWKDGLVGATATALLFLLGKFAISYYIGRSKFNNSYGAAGSLVIVLAWVYYSAAILYFGAELTKVYARLYGGGIIPNRYAIRVQTTEVKPEPPGATG